VIGMDADLRADRMALVRDRIDALGAGATLAVYAGARPATGGAETTKLVEFELELPCGSVSGPTLTLTPAPDAVATGTGSASWARVSDAAGGQVLDLSVGLADSAAEVWLDELGITAGRTVEFISGELNEGNP
jgi:hypothetical protein